MAERVQLERLHECEKCGYAACICAVLKAHRRGCTRRAALLCEGQLATACQPHDIFGCIECWPCSCKQ